MAVRMKDLAVSIGSGVSMRKLLRHALHGSPQQPRGSARWNPFIILACYHTGQRRLQTVGDGARWPEVNRR